MKRKEDKFMQNKSGTVRAAGIIALLFFVTTVAWNLLRQLALGWISSDPQQAAADMQAIVANQGQYLGFVSVDILCNLGIFALGALFYLIFRSFNRSLALFGGLGFMAAGIVWLILDMPGLAQYKLALDYSASSGAAASAIAQRGADLSLWGNYSFAIASILIAIGLLSFGLVIIRSIAINRLLGWLAIIAGILMLVSLVNTFSESAPVTHIAYYVTEVWALVTGIWLILRGVKNSEGEPLTTAAKS